MMTFGDKLKMARVGAGFKSAEQFAKAIRMKPSRYRHYEAGRRQPDLKSLVTICDGLGITPDVLLWLDKDVA